MEQRLTQAQLEQIVAEVQQLSQRQKTELNTAQVKEILEELNLPSELLDEALVQLQRRQALAAQQQYHRWLLGGVIGIITLCLLGTTLFFYHRGQTLARIEAQRDRITLTQDDGGDLGSVPQQVNGDVFYRVTLANAPVGEKLSLSCNWTDPSGQIVHQNRYQTQEITTPVWNTFCRHRIGSAAAVGQWTVQMFLGDRLLSDDTFEVR